MRKFAIDPERDTGERTICNTLRQVWRRADEAGDDVTKELIADCFDYAKRMDEKLRSYKSMMEDRFPRNPSDGTTPNG